MKNVNWFNENFIVANMVWGSIASGYLIYGWKQKAVIPLAGGAAMMAASFLVTSALSMSLVCMTLIMAIYWLVRQGY